MRRVLSSTIFKTQGAFIARRKILDQVIIVNEAIEDYMERKEEKVIFKIDVEKAYDHFDWNFLDTIMGKVIHCHLSSFSSWLM